MGPFWAPSADPHFLAKIDHYNDNKKYFLCISIHKNYFLYIIMNKINFFIKIYKILRKNGQKWPFFRKSISKMGGSGPKSAKRGGTKYMVIRAGNCLFYTCHMGGF